MALDSYQGQAIEQSCHHLAIGSPKPRLSEGDEALYASLANLAKRRSWTLEGKGLQLHGYTKAERLSVLLDFSSRYIL